MAEPVCAACGSRRVQALADAVGCEDCGAATNYDGELVHDPTSMTDTRVSGPGGEGALPPTEGSNMTTTQNYPGMNVERGGEEEPAVEDSEPEVSDDTLGDRTRDELYEMAQEADIPGRSSMTKDELVEALRG